MSWRENWEDNKPLWIACIFVFLLIAVLAILPFVGESGRQTRSHIKSSIVGLERDITLYSNDGYPIKTWRIKGTVEDQGGSFRFMDDNDKVVQIAGTVIIQER